MPFDSESAKRAANKRWDGVSKAAGDDGRAGGAVDPFAELSNEGLYSRTGSWEYSRREFLPQLRGRQAARVYREMSKNNGIIGGILFGITGVVRSVEWHLDPAKENADEEPTPESQEIADFVESCMSDMSLTWGDLISDSLSMLQHGYSFLEIVYKRREGPDQDDASKRSDFDDGKIGWRKFVNVPQDTIDDWIVDDFGGIQAALQRTDGLGVVVIPIDKAVMFKTDRSSPWGESILRTAYVPWYRRKRIEEAEGIGIERDLAGLPVIYAHPDYLAVNRDSLKNIVTSIRRDEQEGVLLPDIRDPESGERVVSLELLTSGGARQFNTSEIIARYTREIAMSVLQDVLLLGHEKVGTQALAREKRDLSDTAIGMWIDEIANVFNRHAIPRLLKLNGLDLRLAPKLVPGDIRDDDAALFATTLKTLADAGFSMAGDPAVEEWVRERFGLPEVSEEEMERLTNPPPPPPPLFPPGTVPPDPEADGEGPPPPQKPKAPPTGDEEDPEDEGAMEKPTPTKKHKLLKVERDADGMMLGVIEYEVDDVG